VVEQQVLQQYMWKNPKLKVILEQVTGMYFLEKVRIPVGLQCCTRMPVAQTSGLVNVFTLVARERLRTSIFFTDLHPQMV
jgi:hypothetical protein